MDYADENLPTRVLPVSRGYMCGRYSMPKRKVAGVVRVRVVRATTADVTEFHPVAFINSCISSHPGPQSP